MMTELSLQSPKGMRTIKDQAMRVLVWVCFGIALVPLIWILTTVIAKGAPMLFTQEPSFTRVCAVDKEATSRADEPFVRVADSECAGGSAGAAWRWVPGGTYVAVGQHLSAVHASTARDPQARDATVVVMAPTSEGAGSMRYFSLDWWTKDVGAYPDNTPGGGILHALVGTLWIGLICAVIAVPLGILGAIYLVEYARGKKQAKVVSFMVDILTGVPSIVAALFIFAVVITIMGGGRSTIAASLALVLLMLPTVLRSTEEMLKLVPDTLREASYALGVPKWKTIMSVVIPTSFNGIATGVVLGLARVMGETAPLLILLNYARNLYLDPLSPTMGSLPTMIANAAALPSQYAGADRGWGAALTLILIVMGLNLLARGIARANKLKEK